MAEIGYFLSSEEHGPAEEVEIAQRAEAAGMRSVWISDHFHPWLDEQGESPFVWSVIGGIAASTGLRVTTAVTCPTFRIHPAINAHAAATASLMLKGRFNFGVGTGENLNEHVLGQRWVPPGIRLEMLEEAVEVMRALWTGNLVNHHGPHYTVENARLYSVPAEPPPVLVSAFGPKAVKLAAKIGDGYINTSPDADLIAQYREHGGKGPTMAGVKVCWGEDEEEAKKLAHRLWRTSGVPGQLSQELPMPKHFDEAAELVTPEQIADKITCGPDPERHVKAIQEYVDAGFDEIYVSQIGPDQEGFFRFYETELAARLGQ